MSSGKTERLIDVPAGSSTKVVDTGFSQAISKNSVGGKPVELRFGDGIAYNLDPSGTTYHLDMEAFQRYRLGRKISVETMSKKVLEALQAEAKKSGVDGNFDDLKDLSKSASDNGLERLQKLAANRFTQLKFKTEVPTPSAGAEQRSKDLGLTADKDKLFIERFEEYGARSNGKVRYGSDGTTFAKYQFGDKEVFIAVKDGKIVDVDYALFQRSPKASKGNMLFMDTVTIDGRKVQVIRAQDPGHVFSPGQLRFGDAPKSLAPPQKNVDTKAAQQPANETFAQKRAEISDYTPNADPNRRPPVGDGTWNGFMAGDTEFTEPNPKLTEPERRIKLGIPKSINEPDLVIPEPKSLPDLDLIIPEPKPLPDPDLFIPEPKPLPDLEIIIPEPKSLEKNPRIILGTPKQADEVDLVIPEPKPLDQQPRIKLGEPKPIKNPDLIIKQRVPTSDEIDRLAKSLQLINKSGTAMRTGNYFQNSREAFEIILKDYIQLLKANNAPIAEIRKFETQLAKLNSAARYLFYTGGQNLGITEAVNNITLGKDVTFLFESNAHASVGRIWHENGKTYYTEYDTLKTKSGTKYLFLGVEYTGVTYDITDFSPRKLDQFVKTAIAVHNPSQYAASDNVSNTTYQTIKENLLKDRFVKAKSLVGVRQTGMECTAYSIDEMLRHSLGDVSHSQFKSQYKTESYDDAEKLATQLTSNQYETVSPQANKEQKIKIIENADGSRRLGRSNNFYNTRQSLFENVTDMQKLKTDFDVPTEPAGVKPAPLEQPKTVAPEAVKPVEKPVTAETPKADIKVTPEEIEKADKVFKKFAKGGKLTINVADKVLVVYSAIGLAREITAFAKGENATTSYFEKLGILGKAEQSKINAAAFDNIIFSALGTVPNEAAGALTIAIGVTKKAIGANGIDGTLKRLMYDLEMVKYGAKGYDEQRIKQSIENVFIQSHTLKFNNDSEKQRFIDRAYALLTTGVKDTYSGEVIKLESPYQLAKFLASEKGADILKRESMIVGDVKLMLKTSSASSDEEAFKTILAPEFQKNIDKVKLLDKARVAYTPEVYQAAMDDIVGKLRRIAQTSPADLAGALQNAGAEMQKVLEDKLKQHFGDTVPQQILNSITGIGAGSMMLEALDTAFEKIGDIINTPTEVFAGHYKLITENPANYLAYLFGYIENDTVAPIDKTPVPVVEDTKVKVISLPNKVSYNGLELTVTSAATSGSMLVYNPQTDAYEASDTIEVSVYVDRFGNPYAIMQLDKNLEYNGFSSISGKDTKIRGQKIKVINLSTGSQMRSV